MTKLITVTSEYEELTRLHEERKALEELKLKYQGDEDMERYLQKINNDLFINYLDTRIIEKQINKKIAAA